jgi:hypothetical protein
MADKFNGTTVSLGATSFTPLVSVEVTAECPKIDVTGSADTNMVHEPGIPKTTVTVEIVGTTAKVPGDSGALTVTWADTDDFGTLANAVVVSVDEGGGLDDKTTTRITMTQKVT